MPRPHGTLHRSRGRAIAPLDIHAHKREPLADIVQDPGPVGVRHGYRCPVGQDPGGQGVTVYAVGWYAPVHRNTRQPVVLTILNGVPIGHLDDEAAGVLDLARAKSLEHINALPSMPSRNHVGDVRVSAKRGVLHRIEDTPWTRSFDKPHGTPRGAFGIAL